MRICFLADAGSVNTRSWVDHFADVLGHDVHVVTVRQRGEFSDRVTLHPIGGADGTATVRGKLSYLSSPGRVRELLRRIDPDIVVGYRIASYGYLAYRSGFRPFVAAAQGQRVVCPPGVALKRILVRRVLENADLVTAWAPHMSERLVELGASPERILTCPRGIDLARFSRRERVEDGPVSIISTRGLNRHYRIDVLVRALAIATKELPEATLTIAGAGEAEEELRSLAAEIGVADAVRFVGALDHDQLAGLLRRSKLYASVVRTDGVSASLLEAMACGAFPIVTENDANRHWIDDGTNGLLVADADPEAYAAAFVRAAGDSGLVAGAMSVNRRIVEQRADINTNMARVASVFERLAAGEKDVLVGEGGR